MDYTGGCHCGALAVRFATDKQPQDWSIRACQCSFCRAHAALSTSDPAGSIEFFERRPGCLHRYRFGTRTAEFLICRQCGVYVGAQMATDQGRFAILNVRVLEPVPGLLPQAKPMHYDGESVRDRSSRRRERWSPLIGEV